MMCFIMKKTKGLEYYKKIDDMIVVAVRINFGSVLKIRSFYPANKNKLSNRCIKKEQMLLKGQIGKCLDATVDETINC